MLCFFDPQGHVGMVNEDFTRILGYSLEDFRSTTWRRCASRPTSAQRLGRTC